MKFARRRASRTRRATDRMRKGDFCSKYTKEALAPIVSKSLSIAEVIKGLGLTVSGSMYRWIPEVIDRYGLDRSHFLGIRKNSGPNRIGGQAKLSWEELLVVNRLNGTKEGSQRLRRAMIESGILHVCRDCRNDSIWNGKKLMLQIEHINGNPLDNRRENLCFLCPNCHSQTSTHSVKKSARTKPLVAKLVDAQS
jgi:hypothetical protein